MRTVAIILIVVLVGISLLQFLSAIGPMLEMSGTVLEYLGKFLEKGREHYLESAWETMKLMVDNSYNLVLGFSQSALVYTLYGCILYSLGVIIDKIKPAEKE